MSQLIPPVVLKASKKHTGNNSRQSVAQLYLLFSATLVFLHGLGDTGFGWAGALNTIRPEFLKVTCSHFSFRKRCDLLETGESDQINYAAEKK